MTELLTEVVDDDQILAVELVDYMHGGNCI